MVTLENALDTFDELSLEEKEIMTNLIIKRSIESKRDEIARSAKLSLEEYYAGLYQPKSAKEGIKELHEYLFEEEK